MKTLLRSLIFSLLVLTSLFAGSPFLETGITLDQDLSASNRSLGGGGVSAPGGLQFIKANPAQIYSISKLEIMGQFEQGFFSNQYSGIASAFQTTYSPFSVNVGMQIPQSLESISDEGDSLGSNLFYEGFASIYSGYSFKIKNQTIHTGYGGGLYFNKIYQKTAFTGAVDLGLILPLQINMIRFLKANVRDNLYFGLAVRNLGPPLVFDKEENQLPTTATVGTTYNFLAIKNHSLNFITAGKYYILKSDIFETAEYSVGLQYSVFKILFLRSSLVRNFEKFTINVGGGLNYSFNGLYNFQVDYNIEPAHYLGQAHQVNFKVSHNFRNLEEKLDTQKGKQTEIVTDINSDIITVINDGIASYRLDNSKNPDKLEEILPYLKKKHKLEKIPEPADGFVSYDKDRGLATITTKKKLRKFRDVIILKDGAKINGNIIKEFTTDLVIEHEFGELRIRKSKIAYRYSKQMEVIDAQIVQSLQSYVNQYKQDNGTYPSSLQGLENYLRNFSIKRLPQTSTGELDYNKRKGIVTIKRNISGREKEELHIDTKIEKRSEESNDL